MYNNMLVLSYNNKVFSDRVALQPQLAGPNSQTIWKTVTQHAAEIHRHCTGHFGGLPAPDPTDFFLVFFLFTSSTYKRTIYCDK